MNYANRRRNEDNSTLWTVFLLAVMVLCQVVSTSLLISWEMRFQAWRQNVNSAVERLEQGTLYQQRNRW